MLPDYLPILSHNSLAAYSHFSLTSLFTYPTYYLFTYLLT